MTDDQENTARTAMGGHPGIEMQKERTELNLEKAEETRIEIVIDAMIGTVAMTVTGIETMTAPVAMIRGEGNVLGPGSAAGALIDTESWLADSGVLWSSYMVVMVFKIWLSFALYWRKEESLCTLCCCTESKLCAFCIFFVCLT